MRRDSLVYDPRHTPSYIYNLNRNCRTRAVRFDYEIPFLTSGYVVGHKTERSRVASRIVLGGPETLDLRRLLVIADDIPPQCWLDAR